MRSTSNQRAKRYEMFRCAPGALHLRFAAPIIAAVRTLIVEI